MARRSAVAGAGPAAAPKPGGIEQEQVAGEVGVEGVGRQTLAAQMPEQDGAGQRRLCGFGGRGINEEVVHRGHSRRIQGKDVSHPLALLARVHGELRD